MVRYGIVFGGGIVAGFYLASTSIRAAYGPELARLAQIREQAEAAPVPDSGPAPVRRAATAEDLARIRDNLRKARGMNGPTIDDLARRSQFDRKDPGG